MSVPPRRPDMPFLRLVRGPTAGDRMVALDVIAMAFAALIGTFSVVAGWVVTVDVLMVFAIVVFFGTAVFARYRGKETRPDE